MEGLLEHEDAEKEFLRESDDIIKFTSAKGDFRIANKMIHLKKMYLDLQNDLTHVMDEIIKLNLQNQKYEKQFITTETYGKLQNDYVTLQTQYNRLMLKYQETCKAFEDYEAKYTCSVTPAENTKPSKIRRQRKERAKLEMQKNVETCKLEKNYKELQRKYGELDDSKDAILEENTNLKQLLEVTERILETAINVNKRKQRVYRLKKNDLCMPVLTKDTFSQTEDHSSQLEFQNEELQMKLKEENQKSKEEINNLEISSENEITIVKEEIPELKVKVELLEIGKNIENLLQDVTSLPDISIKLENDAVAIEDGLNMEMHSDMAQRNDEVISKPYDEVISKPYDEEAREQPNEEKIHQPSNQEKELNKKYYELLSDDMKALTCKMDHGFKILLEELRSSNKQHLRAATRKIKNAYYQGIKKLSLRNMRICRKMGRVETRRSQQKKKKNK